MTTPTLLTLCIIQRDHKVLLGLKKRGFGAGLWNGFGGHVAPEETLQEAAVREVREEASLEADHLTPRGVLSFTFQRDGLAPRDVHVFSTTMFRGTPIETNEMKPWWFAIDDLPYPRMWADDIHWLPLLLRGHNFEGTFAFDDVKTLLWHEVNNVAVA